MSILSLVAITKDGFLLMRGVEYYCNCNLSSLGSYPLEEASAQEWNPSIK